MITNRVVHFEIAAEDPERSAAFYRNVFGWKIEKWAGPIEYWLITTGIDTEPGINGALMRGVGPKDPGGKKSPAGGQEVCTHGG